MMVARASRSLLRVGAVALALQGCLPGSCGSDDYGRSDSDSDVDSDTDTDSDSDTDTDTDTGSGPETFPPWAGDAIAYILANQNEDGTWFTGAQVNPDSGGGITVGTTALTGMALLEYWNVDPEGIRPALDEAIAACVNLVWRDPGSANDFDSVNWGQMFTLQLLARLVVHPAWKDRAVEFRGEIDALSPWFYGRQTGSGGFGYNSSFQTGAALIMLHELEQSGVVVDDASVGAAIGLMEDLRLPQAYLYSAGQGSWAGISDDTALDYAAGRQAMSEYSLLLFDRTTEANLEDSFQLFIDHRDFLWETRALTASGEWPRMGSASPFAYFAFFGYRYSAQSLDGVSDARRKEWAPILAEDLLAVQEDDGTWMNLPITSGGEAEVVYDADGNRIYQDFQANREPGSKIYATAMALMAFTHLWDG